MLSLAMIVKNEEKNIRRCLESVTGLVDEMVVVDTGSTDRTTDIAREFGACIHDFEWADDFSLARNFGLMFTNCNNVIVLDADEGIPRTSHRDIKDLIRAGTYIAYDSIMRNQHPGINSSEAGKLPTVGPDGTFYIDTPCRRLFAARPGIAFSGRVHEKIVVASPLMVGRSDFIINHYGRMDLDRQREKITTYLALAKKDYEDNPRDPERLYNYMVQARVAEDWKTLSSLPLYAASMKLPIDAVRIVGETMHHTGYPNLAIGYYHQALKANPQDILSLYGVSVSLCALGRTDEAKVFLKEALLLSPGLAPAEHLLARIEAREQD
jgi:glycosyltransferase involved in cell wall biosynthesis